MKAKMVDQLSCAVCMLQFNNSERLPKMFPCQHTLCLMCTEELIGKHNGNIVLQGALGSGTQGVRYFPCPLCRENVQVPQEGAKGLTNNLSLLGMLDIIEEDHGGHSGEGDSGNAECYCSVHAGTLPVGYMLKMTS